MQPPFDLHSHVAIVTGANHGIAAAAARTLARLPAPAAGDIFLDLEGDPLARDGGRDYLFGLALGDGVLLSIARIERTRIPRSGGVRGHHRSDPPIVGRRSGNARVSTRSLRAGCSEARHREQELRLLWTAKFSRSRLEDRAGKSVHH